MKIAYLHGLESSIDPKDPKIIFLNNNFDEVYTPSIDYRDKNTFTRLYNDIKSMQPDVIVGSSMGGYVSYLIGSKLRIETILFNPAVSGRSFDPIVDDTKLKKAKHNVNLGSNDNVIIGNDVREFFKDKGVGNFTYDSYKGGHRVPADVFINAIKKTTNILEIYKEISKNTNKMKPIKLYEEFISEKREDVGKYNTVKKAMKAIKKEYGPTPTVQSVASFINDNYYDVTEVERGDDDPRANDKIADLVATYKFDIEEWETAWEDAQNESVVTEANQLKKGDIVKFKDGRSIHIIGPKGDGYDYKDGREKGHHPKGWFDMMISSGKAMVESVVTEAFIGPFVFNDKMSDDELKAMYDGALDGYAYYAKGMQYPKSDYKKAYQEIEKILKKRGVNLNEANRGKVHKAAKKGSYPAVVVVVQDGKVIHQESVSSPEVAPATFNVMQEKYPKATIHLEDKTGQRLFSESVVAESVFSFKTDNIEQLHFETDPKTAEEMKIELGKKQGEVSKRKQIESGEYSLRRFRKEIGYGNGKDVGIFLPGSYDASVSKLGDGPHKKAVKAVKWNQKKYDQWLEDMASNGGAENAFDMAKNADSERGLIDWVKKNFRGEDPLQRIQWDIEAFAESVITESETVYHKYDFEGMWAQKLGMTREEYVAHFATMTVGIDEAKVKDSSGKKFEPKGVSFTYTDRGRFYGAYLYDVAKTSNVQWKAKLRSMEEVTEFLALNDIDLQIPSRYDEKELDVICKQLSKKGIVCSHDDSMDVS